LPDVSEPSESRRVAALRDRVQERRAAGGALLRPVGIVVYALVAAVSIGGDPPPSLHGRGIAVIVALVVFAACAFETTRGGRPRRQRAVVVLFGVSGIALALLQGDGVGTLAACVPVFVAFLWLDGSVAVVLAVAAGAGLILGAALHGDSSVGSVISELVLLALMAATATLMRRARDGQEETELLYAELQDARDAQAEAAATAERGRITGELHDVLAHSLSGAAIQLQGARRMLQADGAGPQAVAAVDRAAELVREGLGDARRAVGALRGDALPTVGEIPALVAALREDLGVDVDLEVSGEAGLVAPEGALALYRGVQEALTNAARYAPGAEVHATLRHGPASTVLTVADAGGSAEAAAVNGGGGGGHGLDAMRERVTRAGGTVSAGPAEGGGWRVTIEVPR
jgi:signal transduction histidine kinase